MANGGADSPAPPSENGGEFLLSLLHRRPYQPPQQTNPHSYPPTLDPAIASLGPSIYSSNPINPFPNLGFPTNPFPQTHQFDLTHHQFQQLGFNPIQQNQPPLETRKLVFGSFYGDPTQSLNGFPQNPKSGNFSGGGNFGPIGKSSVNPPPGFNRQGWELGNKNGDRVIGSFQKNPNSVDLSVEEGRLRRLGIGSDKRFDLVQQIDHPGPPKGTSLRSVSGVDAEDSFSVLNRYAHGRELGMVSKGEKEGNGDDEIHGFGEDIVESLGLDDEIDDKDGKDEKKNARASREKESRMDNRGQWLLPQRLRLTSRYMACRNDIHRYDGPLLAVYKSLIPAEEELEKQRQLMAQLENLVAKEWPRAKLYLYGSCANSFGFAKSDIDVCLAIEDDDVNKSEMLLKLADILESDNLQNVQALTRARVPIVKLMDPVTGISCDICINNVLAVVNTKLLRDYARIDPRLRQLAFIVKHWAKSRRVNATYQGTLSSYAYVVMCIHFLQQRRPPILPCLQEMDPTYSVRVDNIRCSYFDNVERLANFGASNRETIAELVWGFFNYWAYAHDYANTVVSMRTGCILGKREKDWTRRVGNDRHLICIEDPFETSHDLGRVVDKFSIRVLREEFERAAKIMHQDPNPCAQLFEPYVPQEN